MITKQSLIGIISLLSVSAFAFGPTINPTIGGGALGGTNISVGFAGLATNGPDSGLLLSKVKDNSIFKSIYNGIGYTKFANPIIPAGCLGITNLGAARDMSTWYARGKVWIAYIANTNKDASPNYGTKVCLSYSTNNGAEGSWTHSGVIVYTNGQWGCLTSMKVLYDATNDLARMYLTVATNDNQYYTGPFQICELKTANGADFTLAASWTWQNNTNPVLGAPYASYEGTIGAYAPWVGTIGGTNAMFYSTTVGGVFSNAIAYAPTLDSVWTRIAGCVFGPRAEEPNIFQFPDGSLLSIEDGNTGISPILFRTADTNGLTGWFEGQYLFNTEYSLWEGRHVGSSDNCLLPDGRYFFCYWGATNGTGNYLTSIGGGYVYFEPTKSTVITKYLVTKGFLAGSETNLSGLSLETNTSLIDDNSRLSIGQNKNTLFGSRTYAANINGLMKVANGNLADPSGYQGLISIGNKDNSTDNIGIGALNAGELTLEAYTPGVGFYVGAQSVGSKTKVGYVDASGFHGNSSGLTNVLGTSVNTNSAFTYVPTTVTVGGSPFTFANNTPNYLEVYLTDTAAFSVTKNGVAIASSITSDCYFTLQPASVCIVTYASTTPLMKTNAW